MAENGSNYGSEYRQQMEDKVDITLEGSSRGQAIASGVDQQAVVLLEKL